MSGREELLRKRIAVVAGGCSAEREVSLKSGTAVFEALKKRGYDTHFIDADENVCAELKELAPHVAFLVLHGGWGENGAIQGMLEVMGIPYTGSGVLASALAMDKIATKRMFEMNGLLVPEYRVFETYEDEVIDDIVSFSNPPWVVKPSREGSSIGVSIPDSAEELEGSLKEAFRYDGPVIVERYVQGKEIQIGILADRVLGGVEVRPKGRFYDYEAKYTKGMTDYILPPEIDPSDYKRAGEVALKAHKSLGCSGATRVDLILTESKEIYALEVNTIPGMTETSLLPKIAALSGYGFIELLEEILIDALEKRDGKEG